MTRVPEQSGKDAEVRSDQLTDRLEHATDRLGEHLEDLMRHDPDTRAAAEATLEEIDRWMEPVDALERSPGLAALSDLELLEATSGKRGDEAKRKRVRANHGTEKPRDIRQKEYRRAGAIGRNTAVSGPDRQTRPSAAVMRHWLTRGDNRERLDAYRESLERGLDALAWGRAA